MKCNLINYEIYVIFIHFCKNQNLNKDLKICSALGPSKKHMTFLICVCLEEYKAQDVIKIITYQ